MSINDEIRDIMTNFPTLTSGGFRNRMSDLYQDERNELANDLDQQVSRCKQYLLTRNMIKLPHLRGHSYGLKHAVEQWQRETNLPYIYISEGAAIAAGLILGFAYKIQNDGSVLFGVGVR